MRGDRDGDPVGSHGSILQDWKRKVIQTDPNASGLYPEHHDQSENLLPKGGNLPDYADGFAGLLSSALGGTMSDAS